MRHRNLENVMNGNWAYTGSIAMKLHANRLGVPFLNGRKIRNINIAVENPSQTGYNLMRTGKWNFSHGPPGPGKNHVEMKSTNRSETLNLFRLGGMYAPGGKNSIRYLNNNNVPVINLKNLLKTKHTIAKNRESLRKENVNKTMRNINFLERLVQAQTSSPRRTKKAVSPKKRRRNNSPYRTPSPPSKRY